MDIWIERYGDECVWFLSFGNNDDNDRLAVIANGRLMTRKSEDALNNLYKICQQVIESIDSDGNLIAREWVKGKSYEENLASDPIGIQVHFPITEEDQEKLLQETPARGIRPCGKHLISQSCDCEQR